MEQTSRGTAVVTGASSGIGAATAIALAQEGYRVIAAARRVDRLSALAAEHPLIEARECDVTDDDAVKQAIATTVACYGRLDAAFNGAGMDGANAPTAEASMDNWQRVLAVNLTATFSCMRYQLPNMVSAGGGSIVNCSSVAGLVGAPNLSAYVAAKHGIVGLTKAAALEYAKAGVRVNAVCPAMIDTPMSREGLSADVRQMLMEQSPIGRFGEAADVASLVLWLCGVGGSNYVTGQAIAIDGGWTTR